MKRLLSTFVLFFATILGIFANPVGLSTAMQAGQNFLSQQRGTRAGTNLQLAYRPSAFAAARGGEAVAAPLYVFVADGGGFVIVAGDDRCTPILGYSESGSFANAEIPANMQSWLAGYEREIRSVVESDLAANATAAAQWEALIANREMPATTRDTRAVSPLVRTTWDQSPYYNNLCPYNSTYGERTVTGCVATAMAQVMKYWEWPVRGTGSYSYNCSNNGYNYGTLSANFGNTTYDWASMPLSLSSSSTTTQRNAVATLMYHCGVSVRMSYGVGDEGGSGAFTILSYTNYQNCTEYALPTYFGYKTSLHGEMYENYTTTQWRNLLKTDLDAGRPVIYCGYGDGGGHCFVCDGYNNNNYFHFNWGWSGYYDGYFTFTALAPGGGGVGGGSYDFTQNQMALFGIEPNRNTTATNTVDYALVGYADDNENMLSAINLSLTDSLIPNIVLSNIGPDVPAATDTIAFDINVDGQYLGYVYLMGSQVSGLTAGEQWTISAPLLSASTLEQAGYGDGSSFELCFTVRIISAAGTVDPVSSNNSSCITVNRGSTTDPDDPDDNGECSGNTVLMQDCEGSIAGWTVYDADGDGYNWGRIRGHAHSGSLAFYSESYIDSVGGFTPDNWLYSPTVTAGTTSTCVSWWVSAGGYPDHYQVKVGLASAANADYVTIYDETLPASWDWAQHTAQIPAAFAGQNIKIAFVHNNCTDQFYIFIDDVEIKTMDNANTQYTIATAASPAEGGTTTGDGTYLTGTQVTLTATPNAGYVFTQWSDGNTNATRTITAASSTTYTAYFVGSECEGQIALVQDCESDYTEWFAYDIDEDGNNWSVTTIEDGSHSGEKCFASMSWNNTSGALFPDNWLLAPAVTMGAGEGCVSWWSADMGYADHYQVKVGLADADFSDYVTIYDETLPANRTWAQHSATIPFEFANQSVRVAFVHNNCNDMYYVLIDDITIKTSDVLPTFTITTVASPADGGTTAGGGVYAYGTQVTITATPAAGHAFTQWSDGNTSNPRIITVTEDATYTAEFEVLNYNIVVNSADNAMGTATGGGTFAYGTQITISATPATGHAFTQWSDGNTSNPRIITVTEDATYTAEFEVLNYNIVVNSANNAMGTATGGGVYAYGSQITITATPAIGHAFTRWSDGNTSNPRTITVTEDATYTAEFEVLNYNIVVNSSDNAMGTATGGGVYAYGSQITISATPAIGHAFTRWSDGNTSNPRTITVTEDATYTAEFEVLNYNIVVNSADNTMGTATGGGVYAYGTQITISATPATGHAFTRWSDGNTSNPRTITVTEDATYTAEFEVLNYNIVVNSSDNAMGTATGGGVYAYGTQITISATPATGHAFTRWSDGNTSNPRTITVTEDATYTAEFEVLNYNIVVNSADNAMGTAMGGGTFAYGTQIIITATANEGYLFTQWSDGSTDNPRTITVAEDATYTAFFAEVAAQTFTITTDVTPLGTGSVLGGGTYPQGAVIVLNAVANQGHAFTQWSDGNTDNPRTITVTEDATYTAEFEVLNYNIVVSSADNAMGTATGGGVYAYGSQITITATPAAGHAFTQWSDGNTDNPRTITVTEDATYTAEFEVLNYNIVVNSANNAMGTATGGGVYAYGSQITISATPAAGHAFTQWSDGNTDNPRTITVTGDATYTAEFEVLNYNIVVNSANNAMGTATGGGVYAYGSQITISATPATGHAFTQWSDGNTDNPRIITVTEDATYTAEFEVLNYNIVVNSANNAMGTATGGGVYAYGSQITISATPATGHAFTQWSDGNTDNPRIITVTGDATYTANFAVNAYTIVVSSADNAMGTAAGGGVYNYGLTITISATPAQGYQFTQWNDGNTSNPRQVVVTGDATYTANFAAQQYVITVSSDDLTMGFATGGGLFSYGDIATLEATPQAGYRFVRWNDSNTDNPRNVQVVGDADYIAYFELEDGISENDGSEISLFPNPTTGRVTISGDNLREVRVYDMTGRQLRVGIITTPQTATFDLTDFTPGVYNVAITTDRGVVVKKVVR